MSGPGNFDKTPIPGSIGKKIIREQEEQDERQPKGLPCKITGFGKNKMSVMVQFLTDPQSKTLPTDVEIPINGTRYMRYPWQIGDFGYVLPSQLDTGPAAQNFSTNQQTPFFVGANMSSMAFHPLGNQNMDPPDDPDSVQHNGPTGTINRPDNKKSQHRTKDDGSSKVSGDGDGQGNFKKETTHDQTAVTHKADTKVTSDAPTHEVTQDQTVGGNHTVAKSITAAQTISAGQSMSAPTGNFAGGAIGGVPFGGGGFGGIMGIAGAGGFAGALMGFLNGSQGSGGDGGGLTDGALAPDAAANNVGPLGGCLKGSTLPNPRLNYDPADLPGQFADRSAAVAAGLEPGDVFLTPRAAGDNTLVFAVVQP